MAPVAGEFGALLENERVPDAVPLPCGVKATLTVTLCPAGMVSGNDAPCKANCELLLLAEETVTLAPLALSVVDTTPVVPTVTLPKFREPGLTMSWPDAVFVPVPVKLMLTPGPKTKALPNVMPALWGAKVTFNVTLCPLPKVTGKLGPLTEKAPPRVCNPESVSLHGWLFVRTTGVLAVVPTPTEPNEILAGLGVTA